MTFVGRGRAAMIRAFIEKNPGCDQVAVVGHICDDQNKTLGDLRKMVKNGILERTFVLSVSVYRIGRPLRPVLHDEAERKARRKETQRRGELARGARERAANAARLAVKPQAKWEPPRGKQVSMSGLPSAEDWIAAGNAPEVLPSTFQPRHGYPRFHGTASERRGGPGQS